MADLGKPLRVAASEQFLLWSEGGQPYALPIRVVERVLQMVEVRPLPKPPPGILGLVDIHGSIVPVVSLQQRAQGTSNPPAFDDQLILINPGRRRLLLAVQCVLGLEQFPETQVVPAGSIDPTLAHAGSVLRTPDGLVLVPALEQVLTLEDHRLVDDAISGLKE